MQINSSEKLSSNPYKKESQAWQYIEICELDYKTGFSKIIGENILEQYGLRTTNGGSWCRDDGALGRYFNIERIKKGGRIVGVQLHGYKKNTFSNNIKKEIRDVYSKLYCKVLAIGGSFIEIDHKDGRKDDFGMPDQQNMNDFQPLHRNVNIAKREHCKQCKETNIRFDGKRLGYSVSQWAGGQKYLGSCIGCFWYDPAEFNTTVSEHYKKER